jgi:predicted ATPase
MSDLQTRPFTAAPPAGGTPTGTAAGALWQVRLLGGFVLDDGRQQLTRLRSRAAMALMARLAMAPGRAHAREELAALLWPEAAGEAGRNRLRQTLSYLKAILEPPGGAVVLLADRRVVRVAPDALWCDVPAFEQALRSGRHADAQALYRGELLPGFYDEWVHDERQRLQALAERLADAPAATLTTPAAAAARPSVPAAAPLTLVAAPLTLVAAAQPREPRLPQYLTRLIGADVTGARLRDAVLEHRFVSVLGAGGTGKTRLAVEVARLLCQPAVAGEPDAPAPFERAVFVSLVGATTATQLLDQVLMSLRLGAAGDPFAKVLGALDGQALLVVLDNCEQLDDAAVTRTAELAEQLPLVHWLATSRRPLGLNGEREFMLDALELPAPDAALAEVALNPAVALFVDRARAHRVEFHLTAGNRDSLIALVHWLGGLPLAVELAASRARSLSPEQMLALLQDASRDASSGAAALAWLSRRGTRSGSDDRHASMLAVIDWSWQLLDTELRETLALLCALPAGAGSATVAAVCGVPPAQAQARLDALVSNSVLQLRDGQDGQPRGVPTEPIRQFVAAQQSDAAAATLRAALRRRALQWAASLPATPPLATVREELPNLLAVMSGAVADGHGDDAVRLMLQLQPAWGEIAIPHGALDVLAQVLAAPGLDPSLAAGGHALAAWSCFEAGRRDAAQAHAAQALRHPIDDEALRATVLHRVARLRWRMERDHAQARALIEQALPLARRPQRASTEAALISLQAVMVAAVDRDADKAEALHRHALALWRQSGNAHLVNAGRFNLATHDILRGRPAQALPELQALAEEGRALQDWDMAAGSLDACGTALLALRRWANAAQAQRASLALAWDTMEQVAVVFALWNIAPVLARLRRPALAAQTMGFAEQCWHRRFGDLDASDRRDVRRVRRFVRLQLPAAEADAAWDLGRRRTMAQAVRAVLEG